MPSRVQRRARLQVRLQENRPDGRQRCWVMGCQHVPGNASGNGLGRFCRPHLDHWRRHGSAVKDSYTAAQANPYRRAAMAWIAAHRSTAGLTRALTNISMAYLSTQMRPTLADHQLARAARRDRVWAIWAKLRRQGTDPELVLASVLGIGACWAADPQRPSGREYLATQVGKVLNRMAGGTVKRYQDHALVLRFFPPSEGPAVRMLGGHALQLAAPIYATAVAEIADPARGYLRPVTGKRTARPWNSRRAAKRKSARLSPSTPPGPADHA